MTSGGHEVDVGGTVPDYKYMHNKPESEVLAGQVEYSSCERLEYCLAMECSMKSSTLFERRHLRPMYTILRPSDVIDVICVPRPSPFFFFLFFRSSAILNVNRTTKTGEVWERGYPRSS